MTLTKQQKVFGGLLVVGLIALGIDRATGNDGAPAAEESVASAALPGHAADAALGGRSTSSAAPQSLASRLGALAKADGASRGAARDPFRVGRGWVSDDSAAPPAVAAVPFNRAHRLTAVVLSGRRSLAVIDGNLVPLGGSVDGHRLVSVTQDMAVLEAGESRVLLSLETAAGRTADVR